MSSGDVQGLFTEPLIFTSLKGWQPEAALLGFKSSPGAVRMRKAMHVRAYVYWCDCACGGLRQLLRESPPVILSSIHLCKVSQLCPELSDMAGH